MSTAVSKWEFGFTIGLLLKRFGRATYRLVTSRAELHREAW